MQPLPSDNAAWWSTDIAKLIGIIAAVLLISGLIYGLLPADPVATNLPVYSSSPSSPSPSVASSPFSSQSPLPPGPIPLDPDSPPGVLAQAKLFMKQPMSEYDAREAAGRLQSISKSAPEEYREAQRLLRQIKSQFPHQALISPVPSPTPTPEAQFPEDLIRKRLARAYPNDYVTQKGVLDMEIEAFEYMKTLPDSKIKRNVQRAYPYDFTTQKGVYDMQIEAREQLEQRRHP